MKINILLFYLGLFWTIYGVATKDNYVIIPNGIGAALAVIQLFLCVLFRNKAGTK
jgi:solute carrier family 50 protein (sugar transporter)